MVKDYIQDIVPPRDEPERKRPPAAPEPVFEREPMNDAPMNEDIAESAPTPIRGIRNINVTRERRGLDRREAAPIGSGLPIRKNGMSLTWLIAIIVILVIVLGVVGVFLFRPTTVTVTPRSQTIVFDASKIFTAYPVSTAAPGTLSYSVQSFDLEDSEVVASTGSAHAEHKASGTVTMVNEFSSAPVHLIKTTRLQTPDGHIFRAPEDITVPGMKGSTPGTIDVILVADQTGSSYNIGPFAKLTLPGLKGGAMATKVYARSTQAFAGGFSGDEPAVTPETRSAAVTEIRARIADKVKSTVAALPDASLAYVSLVTLTVTDEPNTATDATHVRIGEKVHVDLPIFIKKTLTQNIASTVSADAENADLALVPQNGFGATAENASTTPRLGTDPVSFAFSGSAQIVWNVDGKALATALAGKSQGAFQGIVKTFPGIQEARARIEPFWKSSFPADPTKIHVLINPPGKQ